MKKLYSNLLLAALTLCTTVAFSQSTPLTISEIQETTESNGDSPYVGQAVLTGGIVTAVSDNGFWIQDGEGAWTGIFVRTAEAPTVAIGDLIGIDATVQENYGLTRLNDVVNLQFITSGNALPAPTPLTTGTAGVEEYESVLITIAGATCVNNNLGYGEWAINDGSGQYAVVPELYDAEPVNFTTYDVTGIAHYSYDAYKMLPRDADDVVEAGSAVGLSFEVSELNVNEADGTVTVNVEITNPPSTLTTVEVSVSGGTAVSGTHFEFADPTTLTFEADATDSQSFTFDLIDDDEENEARTIIFVLQNASSNAMHANSGLEVVIADDEAEVVITPIGVAAEVDDQGVAINLAEIFTITGIVHGVNMNGNGLQITLIDETGGVGLYSPTPVLSYEVVTEGDSIVVTGTVDQYNGLTQLKDLTSVELISPGHDLMDPIVATELIEDYESLLVTLECVSVVDGSQWTNEGSGFNVTVQNADGDQFAMRIDNDVDLYGATPPEGTFNLTGIVGQFTFDAPYLSGYQVIPRYALDIDMAECGVPDGLEDINNFRFDVYPNPASDHFFVEAPIAIQAAILTNVLGQEVKAVSFNASQSIEINVNGLDAGIYILQLRSVDNQISTTKVVVE